MPIESGSPRVAPTSTARRALRGTHAGRVAVAMRCIGFVVGLSLLAAGVAIALLALHGLSTLPTAQDLASAGGDTAPFRCGMPVAAAIVGLMFSVPVAAVGGALTRWCRPARMQRRR
jgi:hypothetical protein